MKGRLKLLAAGHSWTLDGEISISGECEFSLGVRDGAEYLLVASPMRRLFPEGLAGEMVSDRNGFLLNVPLDGASAAVVRRIFPWTAPGNGEEGRRWLEFPAGCDLAAAFAADGAEMPVLLRGGAADAAAFYLLRRNLRLVFAAPDEECSPLRAFAPFPGEPAGRGDYVGKTFVSDRRAFVFDEESLCRAAALAASLRRELQQHRHRYRERARLWVELPGMTPHELLFLGRELGSGVVFGVPGTDFDDRQKDYLAALHFGSCSLARRDGNSLTFVRG